MYDNLKSPGRNDECWCGSGRKYKKCHLDFDERLQSLYEQGFEVPQRSLLKTPEEIEGIKRSAAINIGVLELVAERMLDPVAVLGLPARAVDIAEIADISCGRRIPMGVVATAEGSREPKPCEKVALVWDGALVGIWERRGTDLVCSVNFPQAIEGVR